MSDRFRVFARLADELGIPAEDFTRREDLADERHSSFEETAELREYWDQIEDRQARRRCLSYVESAAKRTDSR